MDEDAATPAAGQAAAAAPAAPLGNIPEVEMYCYLLVIMHLVDRKQWEQVGTSFFFWFLG